MRMRKKKNLVPRMERCGAVHVKDGPAMRGHWRDLMPGAAALYLELGCGKGRFTVETARQNPEVLFIAVEKVADAQVVAMERAMEAELKNVFFLVGDAAALPELFAPGEVDRIFLNFCDPWPPKRQAKRRLTHRNFLSLYRQVLPLGGEIHFKTDNENAWMGVTVTRASEKKRLDDLKKHIEAKHYHATFEPLFEDIGEIESNKIIGYFISCLLLVPRIVDRCGFLYHTHILENSKPIRSITA